MVFLDLPSVLGCTHLEQDGGYFLLYSSLLPFIVSFCLSCLSSSLEGFTVFRKGLRLSRFEMLFLC